MIYLDSAAVVKLVHAEAESQALRDWLGQRSDDGWVSSVLAEVETFRAVARHAPGAVGRLGGGPVSGLLSGPLLQVCTPVRPAPLGRVAYSP